MSWKSKNNKKTIIFGVLAGIATALTNLIWGGGVFIFLVVSMFAFVEILLNKFSRKDFYSYLSWIISSILLLMIMFSSKYNLGTILLSSTTAIALFVLVFYIIDYFLIERNLLNIKDKFGKKIPTKVISLILAIIMSALVILILFGGRYFTSQVQQTINTLTIPFATDRWVRTVAENSQPYISDWINGGQFGKTFFWFFIFGSILLFYEMNKDLKRKILLTIIYTLLLFGFIFSRYSSTSTFNGINSISILIYLVSFIGLLLLLFLPHLYSQYKNINHEELKTFDKKYLFVLIWFFIMVIAARGAVRLLFIFSPIISILAAYLIFWLYELSKNIKGKIYHILSMVVLGVISLLVISSFASISLSQASSVGPTYNQQWQYMGQWIRQNTNEKAVFAHWWDYGYLVQYNQRATISDGGNAGGYEINFFTGRHVLTGQTEQEALEFLKSRNVTHLLIISDEIGKYPAYSSIGSDVNYDRYSWIVNFVLDDKQTQETRNETQYVYTGGFPLDEDLVYQGKVYPRQAAGIGAIVLPIENLKNNETLIGYNIKQPYAILVYNGQQVNLPLKCVYINNQKYDFNEGINGCFRVIPVINNDKVNAIGAGVYLSPKVKDSLFAELYLYDKKSDNFKLEYSDESQIPLAIYNGRMIGPYKIWSVNYPDNLSVPEEYYKRELPDPRVAEVKDNY